MKDKSTPETDAFFRSFADGDATPSHAEYYDRMMQLERERDEALNEGLEQARLLGMSGEREAKLIAERDEARAGLEQAKQDAKQHEVDCLRALGERNEAREEGLEQARLLGMSGEREAKLITQRDEALRLLEKWEQVAIGGGTRILELTKQRDKLAEAAKLIADEYEDRRCQFGGDPLWIKHEQGSAIENALAIINEHHHE